MSNSISWYEEDFTAFLLSLNLPAYRKDMIIIDVIKSEQEQFKSHFKEMIERDKHRGFSKRFYNSLDELLPKVEYVFQSLIDMDSNHMYSFSLSATYCNSFRLILVNSKD